ncbi:hypothetical protein FQZ97_814010 [compost metagenome]
MHQIGIRHQLGSRLQATLRGVAGEGFGGAHRPEKAPDQGDHLRYRGAAAPQAGATPGDLEHIDEEQCLGMFAAALATEQRHPDIGTQVAQQAPEQRVADLVQPNQAKELQRLEPGNGQRPLLDKAQRQPAGLGERRQQQGVGPQQESQRQAAQGAGTGALFPVHATEHRRGELRHCGEGHQADRDQGIGFAGRPVIHIAEQHQQQDGAATDTQQQPRKVAPLRQAECLPAQQQRHHQVVADHGRERDGFDDDHAGGGRQPADEHQQRQRLLAMGHGQGEDEGVGIHRADGKMHETGERDRQHEDIDRQQVQREQPDGLGQVVLVDVLHHADLELAWQEEDRQHRQEDQRSPGTVSTGRAAEGQQLADIRQPRGLREHVGETMVKPEGDV